MWTVSGKSLRRIERASDSKSSRCQYKAARMGTSEFCSCDYVEVRDGANSSARLLGTFCGTNNTDAIYSSGRHLWVRFRSDDAVADSGFVAQFSSEKYRKGKLYDFLGVILTSKG